jgi:hypothetical protein
MCNSISIHSIKKANSSLRHRQSRSFTADGNVAEIRCHTIMGSRMLSVPKSKILEAANNALRAH